MSWRFLGFADSAEAWISQVAARQSREVEIRRQYAHTVGQYFRSVLPLLRDPDTAEYNGSGISLRIGGRKYSRYIHDIYPSIDGAQMRKLFAGIPRI